MDVTTNGLSLPAIRSNSDSTANNDQQNKKNYTRFNDRVAALREYKKETGHVNVSRKIDKSLFNWCMHIRSSRNKPGEGKLKLTADRIAALDAIGFDWRSEGLSRNYQKHISFQDRVDALREYKKETGHLNVKQTDDKSLFTWCTKIRSSRNKPGEGKLKLTADRISALDAIGFNWRTEIAPRNCEKIIDHVEAFAALDAIGFDWRLSKSVLQPFDSLGNDADKASGKSEENNNTVQNWEDGRQHDDLERVGISDALFTSQEINHDGLIEEEKIMFDAIERSISAAEE
jgi:hypothetical protein